MGGPGLRPRSTREARRRISISNSNNSSNSKRNRNSNSNNNSASNSNRHQTTMGLSFRSRGLRADVGWPLDFSTPPKLYLNVDVD